jgi:hypothetical protein
MLRSKREELFQQVTMQFILKLLARDFTNTTLSFEIEYRADIKQRKHTSLFYCDLILELGNGTWKSNHLADMEFN